ncbi:MAG: hypothetical protein JWQ03_884 [Variovorax sp.]|nr:hypothetical protein [Variovorax sp.]
MNNQHDATVYLFFGTSWRAPLVLVVLAAFAVGLVVGALGMVPGWWKHRSAAARRAPRAATAEALARATASPGTAAPPATPDLPVARQHGL